MATFGALKRKKSSIADSSRPSNHEASHSSKRQRQSADLPIVTKPLKQAKSDRTSSSKYEHRKSTLARTEEPAFPRGGASVLTPLEQKQIQIEATRDVLFEQNEAKDAETKAQKPKTTKKKGSRSQQKVVRRDEAPRESIVHIQGLSYKRLTPGTLVLGQVSEINEYDVALALSNNLTGYVPLTAMSHIISRKLDAMLDNDSSDDEESDDRDNGAAQSIDLKEHFSIGQYLRASVITIGSETSDGAASVKRHLELSLEPEHVNRGLDVQNLIPGATIQVFVSSVEDHGLIVDLGLSDKAVRGFVSSKDFEETGDLSAINEGTVLLCDLISIDESGKTLKLRNITNGVSSSKKLSYISDAPTIDPFIPGTAIEFVATHVTSTGLAGKVMGSIDVVADVFHSTALSTPNVDLAYKVGSKYKARIISTLPSGDAKVLGVSLLHHVKYLRPFTGSESKLPLNILPRSSILDKAKVVHVEPQLGLFLNLGEKGLLAFVHISKVKDSKLDTLPADDGPYKVGSTHRLRIMGYNPIDAVFLASLQQSVIEQPFLFIEDVSVGAKVTVTVEKVIINASGFGGLVVNLAKGISGFVPDLHVSDVKLSHPETKYKEGSSIKARVLSSNSSKRQIRLTLKKSLIKPETSILETYEDASVGDKHIGTIVKLLPNGAVLQFFGEVRAFLPISEMSEAFIKDPFEHFYKGQTLPVTIISLDAPNQRMLVSCRDPTQAKATQREDLDSVKIGQTVSGKVIDKSTKDLVLELEHSQLKAVLPFDQLTDFGERQNKKALKQIKVGQSLEVLVLEKKASKGLIYVSQKPLLAKAAGVGTLITSFNDAEIGRIVDGFITNITESGVFVQFAGGVNALLPKSQIQDSVIELEDFGFKKHHSISCRILYLDQAEQRISLTQKAALEKHRRPKDEETLSAPTAFELSNPIDPTVTDIGDFTLGKKVFARISSIKDTQLNVVLADGIHGRIDMSEIFDSLDSIPDRKQPLKHFRANSIIPVKIIGSHDSRTHGFLPISHRTSRASVFELTAKPSKLDSADEWILTLGDINVGSQQVVFINNIENDYVWANLAVNVRGRIKFIDLSNDISLLKDIDTNFPVGSALKAFVTNVNQAKGQLDLSAKAPGSLATLTFNELQPGMILPGRVTKVSERQVIVQLTDLLVGTIGLTNISDDYSTSNPTNFSRNEIVRVCIAEMNVPNKRLYLSTRPSRVLSSTLAVVDREIQSISDLKVNDILRGFVSSVSDKGLFVSLSPTISALVKIGDLSDKFIKDWKSEYQIDQLVKGRVTDVNLVKKQVSLSLKQSHVEGGYVPLMTFNDLEVGQKLPGKIRKVEEFGAFVVLDKSMNVSGLCHRSEISDKGPIDVRRSYNEDDTVMVKVLKIDRERRRVNLGMKASYFKTASEEVSPEDDSQDGDSDQGSDTSELGTDAQANGDGVSLNGRGLDHAKINHSGLSGIEAVPDGGELLEEQESSDAEEGGLVTSGFDWTANVFGDEGKHDLSDKDDGEDVQPKRKRKKAEPQKDMTGDLDANGPQTSSDFERLLLGQPDSSLLWISYMAHELELSEIGKAREIAERALKTIGIREQEEKFNVWISLLNLENTFGTDESVEEVFKRACQYCDSQEVHERLISIFIQSGKLKEADELYQKSIKTFSKDPSIWTNYAHFLFNSASPPSPEQGRALLARAMQATPQHSHVALTSRFAQLEFKSKTGDAERGRTLFEGLLSQWPKRWDLWNMLIDMEARGEDRARVRQLFGRVVSVKGLKAAKAKKMFIKWYEWETEHGSEADAERVKQRAEAFVEKSKAEKEDG